MDNTSEPIGEQKSDVEMATPEVTNGGINGKVCFINKITQYFTRTAFV